MKMLTYESVETAIQQRVQTKAKVFGQEVVIIENGNGAPPVYKIKPDMVADLYGDWIMPLTKEVQVQYLLRRLDWGSSFISWLPNMEYIYINQDM